MTTLPATSPMPKIPVRNLVAKLTALALSTTAVGVVSAAPSQDADVDADLGADTPIDPELCDEVDASLALGRSLALALEGMRPLSATQIVSTWALSEDPLRRRAVVHALEWQFPLVGDAIAIDHLSRDPDPSIRTAAARAAWVRRSTGGDPGVLARLVEDPDPTVRAVARHAL